MEQYNIKETDNKYKYDFYVPLLNTLIEYDGIQHYKPITYWGGDSKLLKTTTRDLAKNKLAKKFGYKLIRIPYTKYDVLEDYLLWSISKHYKYVVNGVYYKNFKDLCRGEQLPGTTVSKDVKKYLVYIKS